MLLAHEMIAACSGSGSAPTLITTNCLGDSNGDMTLHGHSLRVAKRFLSELDLVGFPSATGSPTAAASHVGYHFCLARVAHASRMLPCFGRSRSFDFSLPYGTISDTCVGYCKIGPREGKSMEVAALVLSCLSLGISGIALYFSFFRRPSLSAYVGPYVFAIHKNLGLSITVPTTIANQANQIGVVRRCSLTITRDDSRQQNFNMVWGNFSRLTEDGGMWVQAGVAHSIPVLGRSSQTRNIEYVWEYISRPELKIVEGTYSLRFDFWSEEDTPFSSVAHKLRVTREEADRLEGSNAAGNGGARISIGVVYLTLDQETSRNSVMTQHEMKRLL